MLLFVFVLLPPYVLGTLNVAPLLADIDLRSPPCTSFTSPETVAFEAQMPGDTSLPPHFCIEWKIRSSSSFTAEWDFDVPPTPHTTITTHEKCGVAPKQLVSFNEPLSEGLHQVSVVALLPETSLAFAVSYTTIASVGTVSPSPGWLQALPGVAHEHEYEHGPSPSRPSEALWIPPERLRSLQDWHLDPELLAALRDPLSQLAVARLLKVEGGNIYSLKVLSEQFQTEFLAEVESAKSKLKSAPNTMNRYGAVLSELGFKAWADEFIDKVLRVLGSVAFFSWGGASIDAQHSFTISYAIGEDEKLARHIDESEVTLNMCIGGTFEGAEVEFEMQRDWAADSELEAENTVNTVVTHSGGTALLHVGQHWHLTRRLHSGQRHNLVLWATSADYRSSVAQLWHRRCKPTITLFE